MASILKMSKPEALQIANEIKKISFDNEKAVNRMTSLNEQLRQGWDADAQRAFDECFTKMKASLSMYTDLIKDYSQTLTKVTEDTFQNDTEYSHQIRAKYGR